MRVFDLDLDFFLDKIRVGPGAPLPTDDEFHPWSEADVREFLEKRCLLSREKPTPGRFVVYHHGAFLYWRELIEDGVLSIPFHVEHVDAHADLGMGDAGWSYVMGEVLHQDVADRYHPRISSRLPGDSGMDEGNYLLFAIGCRWLAKLVYVTHPLARDDLMPFAFRGFNPASGVLELCRIARGKVDAFMWGDEDAVESREPPVPFVSIPGSDYQATAPFDFVVLAHSPDYVPPAAAALIPVILEYIQLPLFEDLDHGHAALAVAACHGLVSPAPMIDAWHYNAFRSGTLLAMGSGRSAGNARYRALSAVLRDGQLSALDRQRVEAERTLLALAGESDPE